jgi:hypothetical protein
MAKRDELKEPIDPDLPEIDTAGVTDLLMQLGEAPSEAKVHLYRVRVGIRPPFAFLEETTAGEFDIADVKARYGGGEFLVRVWQRGVPGFKISQRFSIEGAAIVAPSAPPAPPVTVPGVAPGSPPIIVPQGDNGAAIAAIARVMQDGFAQQSALIAQALNNRGHGGSGMQETLQLLTVAKSLFAGGAGGDQLKLVSDVLGIMREAQPLTGEGGKADGWSLLQSLAERVLPAIIERSGAPALTAPADPDDFAHLAPPTPHPAGAPFAPQPAPWGSVPQQPAPQPNPGGDPMLTRIQAAMVFLAAQAAKGAEPDAYAQLALDSADDATLLAFVHQPDWFERVCKLAPQAATQRAWWERLRAMLIEALAAPPDESGSPENAHFGGDPMQMQ